MVTTKDNQSIQNNPDQLIRHYKIPVGLSKKVVLDTILEKIDEKQSVAHTPNRKTIPLRWAVISAAASLALIITVYIFTASVTLSDDLAGNAFRLPDDSRIVLEGESTVRFSKYFWNRQVKLSGVAYFEVEKGTAFNVKTKLGSVKVLGTRFLVEERDESIRVKCYEGSVQANIKKESHLVNAGKELYATKKEATTEDLDSSVKLPEFAKFDKVFKKEELKVVAKELESFFGVQIEIKNNAKRYFSGSINTGSLESAMDIITGSMQLEYRKIEKNKILITNQK